MKLEEMQRGIEQMKRDLYDATAPDNSRPSDGRIVDILDTLMTIVEGLVARAALTEEDRP